MTGASYHYRREKQNRMADEAESMPSDAEASFGE
jgi:hypothetical protein